MRTKLFRRCPRCETKNPISYSYCAKCELNFQKFENATNKEAKMQMKRGNAEQVLLRKGRPQDVKKYKLLLLTIFLGFVGAHYYYVGRYKMGAFFSAFFCVGVVNAIITGVLNLRPTGDLWQVFTMLVLIWGVVLAIWLIDIVKVSLNKFKIPVSIIKER